jgi:hypothetical protein
VQAAVGGALPMSVFYGPERIGTLTALVSHDFIKVCKFLDIPSTTSPSLRKGRGEPNH